MFKNYFNLIFTLTDSNNSIVVSSQQVILIGEINHISKLLVDYYFKCFSNEKIENTQIYFSTNLLLDNGELKCNSIKIDSRFKELSEIFKIKLNVRLLK